MCKGSWMEHPDADAATDPEATTEPEYQIRAREHGPFVVTGGVALTSPNGAVIDDADNYVLCRCGKTASAPYCDRSHRDAGFTATDIDGCAARIPADRDDASTEPSVALMPHGPLMVTGPLSITTSAGETFCRAAGVALCRCGGSATKPLCDGTHATNGFAPVDPSDAPADG